jgi:hypothetical protein
MKKTAAGGLAGTMAGDALMVGRLEIIGRRWSSTICWTRVWNRSIFYLPMVVVVIRGLVGGQNDLKNG